MRSQNTLRLFSISAKIRKVRIVDFVYTADCEQTHH